MENLKRDVERGMYHQPRVEDQTGDVTAGVAYHRGCSVDEKSELVEVSR